MSKRILFCRVVVLTLVVLVLVVLSGVLSAQGYSVSALERVKAVQERHTAQLLALEGVVGTAVGFNENNRLSVKVFVVGREVAGVPKKLDGVPVRVAVTGKIFALKRRPRSKKKVDPASRFERPVPIGVSTGHPNITAGTIACRVTDGTNVYALSNNHIYAVQNNANIGDASLQPGPLDGGLDPDDAIGRLFDFEPIDFEGGINTMDAAIALSSDANLGNSTPLNGYGTPKISTLAAHLLLNQPVKKYGRSTTLTKGKVHAVNATVTVGYGSDVALFTDQIIITPGNFCAGGDSGSLVVFRGKGRNKTHDHKPVGLLFAGNDLVAVASPIDRVLDRFGVYIDGE
jgi:hypothetical protein